MHLTGWLWVVLLRCNSFSGIQKAPVDQTSSRPPDSANDLGSAWEPLLNSGHCWLYKIFVSHVTIWSRNGSLFLQRIRRKCFKTMIFFFSQLMRHPLIELLHLSICFKCRMTIEWSMLGSTDTSRVVIRGSASMISVGHCHYHWPVTALFIFKGLIFFAKFLEPPLHCFMTLLNSNKKITWICFLT